MTIALTYVGISFAALLLLTILFVIEDIKGTRVFLVRFRAFLDSLLLQIAAKMQKWFSFFTTGFMRILFHYGAHTVLNRILAGLKRMELRVEELVRKNRKVARDLRNRERNHLDDIADHKIEVALTSKEKEKLLSH